MKKITKKIIYVVIAAMFLLTACGKETGKVSEESKDKATKKDTAVEEQIDENDAQESVTDETTEITSDGEIADTDSQQTSTSDSGSTADSTTAPTTGTTTESTTPSTGSSTPSNSSSQTTPSSGTTGSTTTPSTGSSTPSNGSSQTTPSTGTTTGSTTTPSTGSNTSSSDAELKAESDSNASKYMSYYQEVLRLVNEIRAEVGVAPLTLDTTLCQAASMRALEMDYANKLSHTRPDGSDCFTALDFYGVSYSAAGENIAMGYSSPTKVVEGWKNSPTHYENMINSNFTKLGVGYSNMNAHYWAQLFTR